jgi:hypothetical protein
MANTISTSFIAQYNSDVKLAFQRGQLLRGTVRVADANGSTHIFQKIAAGTATDKARNGDVVPMTPTHSIATATLVDKYAAEYIDKLDLLKLNIDERSAIIQTAIYALQRFADSQIVTALDDAGVSAPVSSGTGLTITKIATTLYDNLFGSDVPDDGQVTVAIGWKQYGELMQLQQFAGWEYAGGRFPWLSGSQAVRWMNCLWIPTSGLNTGGSTYRKCYAYHKNAVGHAIGQEISTEINYIPQKAAWLVNSMLSMGAVVIDDTGLEMLACAE